MARRSKSCGKQEYVLWVWNRLDLVAALEDGGLLDRNLKRKKLVEILWRLEDMLFLWTIDHDRRRAADGISFRKNFPGYDDLPDDMKTMPCTVLEMLASLAIRMDYEWTGTPGFEKPYIPFSIMIHNLGIDSDPENLEENVKNWMYRKFKYNGEGSIFPLSDCDCDQRETEIWCQMTRYIGENF